MELGEERVGGGGRGQGRVRKTKAQPQGVELVPVLTGGFCSVEMEGKLSRDPKSQKCKGQKRSFPENVCWLLWGECRMALIKHQLHQGGQQKEPKQPKPCEQARA